MKYIVTLILAFSSLCNAQTLLVGKSSFDAQNDGVWYQKSFPYTLSVSPASWGIRFDKPGYSFGYMDLGKVSSSAVATASDANYNPNSPTGCNGPCWPLSHWYGEGSVRGIYASALKHYGPWSVEAGLYLYKPIWNVHIPDWRPCETCAAQDLSVSHNAKLQFGPMLGIRYTHKQYSLNLSFWQTQSQGGEWSSPYHRITTNLSVGYAF